MFRKGIAEARRLFDASEAQLGVKMRLLDIGGGFPGVDTPHLTFAMVTNKISF
jgi:arginine decarboxylase-like protein